MAALRILLTDGDQRSTLAVTRSLGRAGHHVVVASSHPAPLAGASRYCRRTVPVPEPEAGPDAHVAALDRAFDAERIDMLIPMTDVAALLAVPLRDRRPELLVPMPDPETYARLSDKVELAVLGAQGGIPVPGHVVVSSRAEGLELCSGGSDSRELAALGGYPLVVKPGRSAVWSEDGIRRFGVSLVWSVDELRAALEALDAGAFPLLVQERIVGAGRGVFLLRTDGRTAAVFAHRRLREKPPTGGVSVYRESVSVQPEVRAFAEALLGQVNWEGVAMVEFKERSATGSPYLMEVNGRFWGSLQLALDAGVDFPRLLVESALGELPEGVIEGRLEVRSRWLWGDVDHWIGVARMPGDRRADFPHLQGPGRTLLEMVRPRLSDRPEVLRLSDPRPFLRETANWLRHR